MLAEFARVLTPDGVLVLSVAQSGRVLARRATTRNPFHLHELDRDELAQLLAAAFPARRWYRQRRYFGSAIWSEGEAPTLEAWCGRREQRASRAMPPKRCTSSSSPRAKRRPPCRRGARAVACSPIATRRELRGWMRRRAK